MSAPVESIPRVFLSLVTAPEGMDRSALAQVIASVTGLDDRTVRLRLGMPPPMIVNMMTGEAAAKGVRAIKDRGGDAFAPTMTDIEALGPTLKIRELRQQGGRFHAELWRGPEVWFDADVVQIVVRARTPGSEQKPLSYERSIFASSDAYRPTTVSATYLPWMAIFGFAGAYGLARTLHQNALDDEKAYQEMPIIAAPQSMPSHKLDLHLIDGRVLQIDGDKFGFLILGEQRALSDNVNIDRMCELFVHLNPNVVIDTYFSAFSPPAGHHRLRLPMMHLNNDHVAFAFYSRWCALMYRYVMGG